MLKARLQVDYKRQLKMAKIINSLKDNPNIASIICEVSDGAGNITAKFKDGTTITSEPIKQ